MNLKLLSQFLNEACPEAGSLEINEGFKDKYGIYDEYEKLLKGISNFFDPAVNTDAEKNQELISTEYKISSQRCFLLPAKFISEFNDLAFILAPKSSQVKSPRGQMLHISEVTGDFAKEYGTIYIPDAKNNSKFKYEYYIWLPVLESTSLGKKADQYSVTIPKEGIKLTSNDYKYFRSILRHEFEHYLDVKKYASHDDYLQSKKDLDYSIPSNYFNSPGEVNSFFKQIIFDFVDYIREFRFMDSTKGKVEFEKIMKTEKSFLNFYKKDFMKSLGVKQPESNDEPILYMMKQFLKFAPKAAADIEACVLDIYQELKEDPTIFDLKSPFA